MTTTHAAPPDAAPPDAAPSNATPSDASTPAAIRLVPDEPAAPPINLATFRLLSDRERMMQPGKERAAVRARIMLYLPALLDHIDELAATADHLPPPQPAGAGAGAGA